jgi:hypothetical protein
MIRKDKVWMRSGNENNSLEDRASCGKWVIYGTQDELRKVFPKINSLVDQGRIFQAKYSHRENPEHDLLPNHPPVLCVYADDKTKDKTREELKLLGLEPAFWKYDYETREDWKPGGKLYQEMELAILIRLYKQKEL